MSEQYNGVLILRENDRGRFAYLLGPGYGTNGKITEYRYEAVDETHIRLTGDPVTYGVYVDMDAAKVDYAELATKKECRLCVSVQKQISEQDLTAALIEILNVPELCRDQIDPSGIWS